MGSYTMYKQKLQIFLKMILGVTTGQTHSITQDTKNKDLPQIHSIHM